MKLNLGCGLDSLKGYVNIDRTAGQGIDLVADVSALEPSQFGSPVTEILASHILEHFEPEDVPRVLAHWYDLLAPEGALLVAVPNMDVLAELIVNAIDLPINVIYGQKTDPHRSGFTEATLTRELGKAGFRKIYRVGPFGGPHNGTHAVVAGHNVSLNMRAIK